jgi:hypothetical protein
MTSIHCMSNGKSCYSVEIQGERRGGSSSGVACDPLQLQHGRCLCAQSASVQASDQLGICTAATGSTGSTLILSALKGANFGRNCSGKGHTTGWWFQAWAAFSRRDSKHPVGHDMTWRWTEHFSFALTISDLVYIILHTTQWSVQSLTICDFYSKLAQQRSPHQQMHADLVRR